MIDKAKSDMIVIPDESPAEAKGNDILVIGTSKGNILALIDNHYHVLAQRDAPVFDIHYGNDTLWDGGAYKAVFNTLTDELVVKAKDNVRGIQFFDGSLWYIDKKQGIMNTDSDKAILRHSNKFRALCADEHHLIAADDYGEISGVANRTPTFGGDLPIDDMELIDGVVYTVGRREEGKQGGSMGHIRNTSTERCRGLEQSVLAVTEHNGDVVYASKALFKIVDERLNFEIVKGAPNSLVTSLESVPQSWLDSYIQAHGEPSLLPHRM